MLRVLMRQSIANLQSNSTKGTTLHKANFCWRYLWIQNKLFKGIVLAVSSRSIFAYKPNVPMDYRDRRIKEENELANRRGKENSNLFLFQQPIYPI